MKSKRVHYFVIGAFSLLYVITSLISTIHVIDFFALSNPNWLAIGLAIAFEVGAAASLASIIALKKMNKSMVWALFLVLTAMQAMGNTYYAYVHLHDFTGWSELFGLVDSDLISQKRILSLVSGAILPIVALGFIKALVDYIRPGPNEEEEVEETDSTEEAEPEKEVKAEIPMKVEEVSLENVPEQLAEEVKPIEPQIVVEEEPAIGEPQQTEIIIDESTINSNKEKSEDLINPIDNEVSRGLYRDKLSLKRPHDS